MSSPALAHPATRAAAPPSAARTAALWVFRLVALPQAILFVMQPISIGSFLQGTWEALDLHLIAGGILVLVTWVTGACGLVLAALARRPWLAVGSCALGILTTAQVAVGSTRLLVVHVPLGVALVALALWMCAWSWTRGARWR